MKIVLNMKAGNGSLWCDCGEHITLTEEAILNACPELEQPANEDTPDHFEFEVEKFKLEISRNDAKIPMPDGEQEDVEVVTLTAHCACGQTTSVETID
jgi:hypothetical protein